MDNQPTTNSNNNRELIFTDDLRARFSSSAQEWLNAIPELKAVSLVADWKIGNEVFQYSFVAIGKPKVEDVDILSMSIQVARFLKELSSQYQTMMTKKLANTQLEAVSKASAMVEAASKNLEPRQQHEAGTEEGV